MKLLILSLFFIASSFICSAQSGKNEFISFKELKKNDTLVIDFKYINCRTSHGPRYLFVRDGSTYKLLTFQNFHQNIRINSANDFATDNEKLGFFLKNNHLLSSPAYTTSVLNNDELLAFLDRIENIFLQDCNDNIRIAGSSTIISLSMNTIKLDKNFDCWLLQNNIKN